MGRYQCFSIGVNFHIVLIFKKKVESFGFFLKICKFGIIAFKKWGKVPKILKPQN
jgi:hypothetical protein